MTDKTVPLTTSELIAKVEKQFYRGLITADELSSEMLAIVTKAAREAKESEDRLKPYILTVKVGFESAKSRHFSNDLEAEQALDAELDECTSWIEFLTPMGTKAISGQSSLGRILITLEVKCIWDEVGTCPCKKCTSY